MSQPSPLERAKTAAQNIATALDNGHTAVATMSLLSLDRALRELERQERGAVSTAVERVREAIEDALSESVNATMYPDGPNLTRETRIALRDALDALREFEQTAPENFSCGEHVYGPFYWNEPFFVEIVYHKDRLNGVYIFPANIK